MTTISLVATDQLLSVALNPKLASGDQNSVTLHVDFSSEWDGYARSGVFFTSNDDTPYEKVMTNGECIIPAEVLAEAGVLFIGVRGVNASNNAVKTSSLVKYKISEGAPAGEGTEVEPTANVYQQLLSAYGKTQTEIAVERARITNLARLEEGSTTGDAELIDARTDYTGTTHENVGTHIRTVTEEKVSFVEMLINPDEVEWGGLYVRETFYADAKYGWSGFIPVHKGMRISVGKLVEPYLGFNYYNADKVLIGNSAMRKGVYEITADHWKYIRVPVSQNYFNIYKSDYFQVGLDGEYGKKYSCADDFIVANKTSLLRVNDELNYKVPLLENLFSGLEVKNGFYDYNGQFYEHDTIGHVVVELEANTSYVCYGSNQVVYCLFNNNMEPVKYEDITGKNYLTTEPFTTPPGAKYIAIPYKLDGTDSKAFYKYNKVVNGKLPLNKKVGVADDLLIDGKLLSDLLKGIGNHWAGKTWYAYGTSITDVDVGTGKYVPYLAQLSGMNVVNKGIGGGGITNLGGYSKGQVKSAIMNTTDGKLNADLITLEVGANEGGELGTKYDLDDTTFCGCLNQCIRYLQENTNAQIVVMYSVESRNEPGENINYHEREEKVREVCNINNVYYLGDLSGLGYGRIYKDTTYTTDNIHQTELGGYNLAQFMWSKLKDIPLWYTEIPE